MKSCQSKSSDRWTDWSCCSYGFASFSNVASAHIVAKRVADKRVKGVAITLAPPPSSIIWRNLTLSDVVVFRQKLLGGVILFVVAALYTIVRMPYLQTRCPYLTPISQIQPTIAVRRPLTSLCGRD